MNYVAAVWTLASASLLFAACKNDDDDDNNTSGSGSGSSTSSAWLVGDDGEMVRLAADGSTTPYRLDTDDDLHAIACVGLAGAWVAGSGGTVLSTDDAGAQWTRHDVGTTADLVTIAVSESTPTRVAVAGDGVLLVRSDAGAFVPLGPTEVGWTSLAYDESGATLLAVADDGSVWRNEGTGAMRELVRFADQPLSSVALGNGGSTAVVVGAGGFVARTDDGGAHWNAIAVPTTRDLWAVRVSHGGGAVIAVGEAGVVVRVDDGGAVAQELLDPALSLRAVHMHGLGRGHAVGDAGTVLATADFGAQWHPLDVELDAVLRGVDDLRLGAHW